jgi:hypothetical protein
MLKSRQSFPPGGFIFIQPQTGWQSPSGATFRQTVEEIIKHRRANPRFALETDYSSVERELDAYTCARLHGIRGEEKYVQPDNESKKAMAPQLSNRQGPVAAVAGTVGAVIRKISRMGAGVGTLVDWFGSGGEPVAHALAAQRAAVCVACPKNRASVSWMEWAKDKVAARIKDQLEVKAEMRLTTPYDNKLGTCSACLCVLELKCWTPVDVIRRHMSKQTESDLAPQCWVRTEPHHENQQAVRS